VTVGSTLPREQRRTPLLVGLASVTIGLVLLLWLAAPRELLALVAAGAAGLIVSVTISLWWKMSIHTAVAAGAVTVLVLVFGPALITTAPLVAIVGWARVQLRDHSVGQVVGGALIGAVIAAGVFTTLR
jgi:membrane-associated phospholipid phosphatase